MSAECGRLGINVKVMPPGPSLMSFGKQALCWSNRKKLQVLVTELVPYTARMSRFLRQMKVSLVHANDPRGALLIGVATRLAGLNLVTHLRGRKAYSGAYWRAFELLSHRIITVCNAIQQDVARDVRHKAVTVYNGTDDLRRNASLSGSPKGAVGKPEQTNAFRWLDGLRAEGHLVVSCFASVTPFKGYHHLIDAIAELNSRGFEKVVYLGVGAVADSARSYEAWLYRKMREAEVSNFTLTGWQQDPFPIYRRTDLAVLPSVASETLRIGGTRLRVEGNEGFPRAHLEAAALGLAVVGTDIGGVSELVQHERTGLLVPPGDPQQLAKALGRLLESAPLRNSFGAAAREKVLLEFSIDRCVRDTLGVYQAVI